MEMQTYVEQIRAQLAASASLGDEQTRRVAEALAVAVEPAVRLVLIAAMSAAADEITASLLDLPGAPIVSVRTDGDEVSLQMRSVEPLAGHPATPPTDEGDTTARISLRLPEQLKADIDAAARAVGASVNSWLVRTAASAVAQSVKPGGNQRSSGVGGSHRMTGWING